MSSIKIIISGRVHGVGFRYFVKEKSKQYVKGYVKNTYNGKVEVEAEGEKSDINDFIEYCRVGTPMSIVERADFHDVPFVGYSGFVIKQ